MIAGTSAIAFRRSLGEMLKQVQYRHGSIVINNDGKSVTALVDRRLFARIRRMQARLDALSARIEAGFAGTPEAEGMAEIAAVVREARRTGAEG